MLAGRSPTTCGRQKLYNRARVEAYRGIPPQFAGWDAHNLEYESVKLTDLLWKNALDQLAVDADVALPLIPQMIERDPTQSQTVQWNGAVPVIRALPAAE